MYNFKNYINYYYELGGKILNLNYLVIKILW